MPKKSPSSAAGRKTRKGSGLLGRLIRRFLLIVLTVVIMAAASLYVFTDKVFHGPSEAARNSLTMTLLESHHTEWIPSLFLSGETIAQIRGTEHNQLPAGISDPGRITVGGAQADTGWEAYPDGVRIDTIESETYTAHVMIIRDPSWVYLSCTNDGRFSMNQPGPLLPEQIAAEGAIAGINAGTVYYDPSTLEENTNMPSGMVVSGGEVLWNSGNPRNGATGFAGFNADHILIVAETMTEELVWQLGIQDGCQFGPVLLMDGQVNSGIYNASSGFRARSCIGQRADGSVVFLCIDGLREGSFGGTLQDCIDLLQEYGCVNACNLEGGSYASMFYQDRQVNNFPLFQEEPQPMPTFWMVRPGKEG